jgi:hypothetical protein
LASSHLQEKAEFSRPPDLIVVSNDEAPFSEGRILAEVDEIETFLEDLRLHNGEQSSIVFERLANLNIGPIRAFVSGSCSEQDLNEVIQEFFDAVRGSSAWQEHFDELNDLDRTSGVSR